MNLNTDKTDAPSVKKSRSVQPTAATPPGQVTLQALAELAELTTRCEALSIRLDEGSAKIEEGRAKGKDVTEWENYWMKLLGQYEKACKRIEEIKGGKYDDERGATVGGS